MLFDYGLFIIFSIILASGTLMISTENPIHAILFLILIFLNGSILFFIMNFEFFALIFLIIYVGAIIVLFLFMIMLLNIKYNDPKNINVNVFHEDYFLIGGLMISLLLSLLFFIREIINPSFFLDYEYFYYNFINVKLISYTNFQNLINLGKELYSNNIYSFILIGILLLISMVGSIFLAIETDDTKKGVLMKTQDLMIQAERNSKNSIYFSFQEFYINIKNEENSLINKVFLIK